MSMKEAKTHSDGGREMNALWCMGLMEPNRKKLYGRARELGFGVDDRRAETLVIHRKGREAALRQLASEFPNLRWFKL